MMSLVARIRALLGYDALVARLMGPGLVSFIIKVASACLSFLMLVAFSRMLSPEDYGYFGIMMNAAVVVSAFCMLGLPVAVMRFWPAHMEQGKPSLAIGFMKSSQHALLLSALVAVAMAIVLAWSGIVDTVLGGFLPLLLTAGLAVVISFSELYSGLLRALGFSVWALLPRDIAWRFLAPAAAALWLFWRGALSGNQAIIVCIVVLAVLSLAQYFVATRSAQRQTGHATPETDWKTWLPPLFPLAGASILFAMVQQLDVVVVGTLVGAQEAGSYFAAQKTASLLGLAMIAGGMVGAPMMSAAFSGGRLHELQRLCRWLAVAIAVVTLAGFGVVAVGGGMLLALFDPSYRSAHGLLLVLAAGYAIDALAGPTAYLMQMTKLENDYLKIMAFSYAIVLALQLALVPVYGPMAAALSTTFGYVIWNGAAIFMLRKKVGVDSSILSFLLPIRQPTP